MNTTLTDRFCRARWSKTRREIDAMAPGTELVFTGKEYFNAKSSVERLNDAYDGARQWTMVRAKGVVTVKRIK